MHCWAFARNAALIGLALGACAEVTPPSSPEPAPPVTAPVPEPEPEAIAGAPPAEPTAEDPPSEPADAPEVIEPEPVAREPAWPVPAPPSPEPVEQPTLTSAEPLVEPPAPMVDEPTVEPDLPEARSATTYTVTPSNTWIYVVVRFDPQALAVALGHDHMVRATRYRSSIVWHPEDASQCDVSFTIPVADLVPDPPGGRKRAGLDELDAVAEKTLGTIQSNFQGKKQLNMAEYPEIRFQSTSCSGTSGAVTVTGELTMRGVTNAISIPMTVDEDGDQFRASGQFTTTHTAFGFKPFSNMAGAFRNLDTLSFAIDVVAAAK